VPSVKTEHPPRNAGAIAEALSNERAAVPVGVKASAEPIQAFLEAKVSVPYPPPSAPGTPAHMRTGKYRRGWNVKARDVTLTITNPVKYAVYLEFGTRYMAKRPALTDGGGGGGQDVRNLVRRAGRSAQDTARRAPLVRTTF
jgi:hypothetical protein